MPVFYFCDDSVCFFCIGCNYVSTLKFRGVRVKKILNVIKEKSKAKNDKSINKYLYHLLSGGPLACLCIYQIKINKKYIVSKVTRVQ